MGLVEVLEPIYSLIPSVKPPEVSPPLKKRIMWSAVALLLFFILGKISVIGLTLEGENQLAAFQEILASNRGTLLSAGIGPIVFASIILQLLVGAKIIDVDLTDPAGKAKFQGMQKLFAIIMCFFQGIIYPASGMLGTAAATSGIFSILWFGAQIALGSILLLYLDEVVSKYGLGSGIGLFIAGGVTSSFFWQLFRPPVLAGQAGRFFMFLGSRAAGGFNFMLLFPVLVAIIIYLIVIYANAIHVNIPITMGRRGFGGRYPVNLLYVSVLPVILASALFANVKIFGAIASDVPVLGDALRVVTWATGNAVEKWPLMNTTVYNLFETVAEQAGQSGLAVLAEPIIQFQLLQGLLYIMLLCVACVVFGKFWVKMGGQSPEDVANQLESSGMYVPGFRKDKRIIEKILNRYIPPIVVIGSIFVGLLAGIGNMALSTLGSGTGILLTVSIVHRLYQQVAREQVKESGSLLKKLIG